MIDLGLGDFLTDAWAVLAGFQDIITLALAMGAAGMFLRLVLEALGVRRAKAQEDD